MAESRKPSLLRFAIIFLLVYSVTQIAMRYLYPQTPPPAAESGSGITLAMEDDAVNLGVPPRVKVENIGAEPFTLTSRCPLPPFNVSRDGETLPFDASGTGVLATVCPADITIATGDTEIVNLEPWKYALFNVPGEYRLELAQDPSATVTFEMQDPNVITQLFRAFVTKPLFNALIFIASIVPDHNLGWSIIILTIIVKLILFIPTQHALEGQQKLQLIQPKIDDIRRKYKGDAAKINEETMKLWKQEKVNPFQSCLPMLLQFPFLIGLFFVIRDGSHLALSRHLIYPMYDHLTWTFGANFLGLNLLEPNLYFFPPALAISQFLQLKLSFAIAERKKAKKNVIDVGDTKPEKPELDQAQFLQQKVMLYGLPFMIAFFALRFPAAVSLYWFISTLFAIGQQLIVNRKHL